MKISRPSQIGMQAKALFAALLNELGNNNYVKIDNSNDNFMPLTVERVGANITGPLGNGYLISLAHHFKQMGDLMRDPEVVFLVVDNRKQPGELEMLGVYPQELTQDNMGIYKLLITIDDTNTVKNFAPKIQQDVAQFCSMWFKNIRFQQGIKPVKQIKPANELKEYVKKADKIAKEMGFSDCYAALGSDKKAEFERRCKKEIGE